jgi:pilus assembly protein FimV
MVSALGMGEITLHSALNQPLNAEIELLDVGSLSTDQIRVALAPAEAFDAAGVERLQFLQDLRFAPLIQGDRSRIRVVSTNPVREPYLNFLVQINRANSRILREYTVLLDPAPVASNYQSSASPAVVKAAVAVAAANAAPSAPAVLPAASKGATHRVASGESLWLIAKALNESGAAGSVGALMRDIQALNPRAFINSDPARLKAGATLLLPDAAAVVRTAPVSEPGAQAPEPEPTPPAEPEVSALRREMLDELAISREENLRLKEMLAQVQAQLESVQAQLDRSRPAPAVAVPEPVAESVSSVEPASESQPEPGAAAPVAAAAPLAVSEAPVASPAAAPAAAPVPVAATDSGFAWLGQWWVPGGLLALLASLVGVRWKQRRRAEKPQPHEPVPSLMPSAASAAPLVKAPAREAAAEPQSQRPAAAASTAVAPVVAAPVAEPDVLQAADLYLTYGRRDEALAVLTRGIAAAPQRTDLRLRALQLLAEAGKQDEYVAAAAGYLEMGGDPLELQRLLQSYPAMAATQAAAQTEQLPAAAQACAKDFDEFPMTLEELSLDADWDLIGSLDDSPAPAAACSEADRAPLFDARPSEPVVFEQSPHVISAADDETLLLGDLPDFFDPFDEGPHVADGQAQAPAESVAESGDETATDAEPKPGKPRMSLVRSA